ncbi:Hypothetical protein A7982_01965 [Minicystis rosea]|nr:Hypothetical protein A7982_01965 [Minicystis rosea]
MTIASLFRFSSPWIGALALGLASLTLCGCGRARDRDLESGHYVSIGGGKTPEQAFQPDVELVLDLDKLVATFTTPSGTARLALIEQESPKSDCAGAQVQWVKLDAPTLTIEGVTFDEPTLVAKCASTPLQVTLGNWDVPPFIDFELRSE